jgi:pimeloyl-ACP methyl ester carboxylesterase
MRSHLAELRAVSALALRVAVAGLIVALPIPARAQQPVMLVHGINADGSTWQSATDYLRSLGYNAQNPTLGQADPLAVQAGRLRDAIAANGFGGNVMLAAHSQGGLISRYTTELTPAKAVVTVGTPHAGAPVAVMGDWFNGVLDEAAWDIGIVLVVDTDLANYLWYYGEWPWTIFEDIAYAWSIGYLIDYGLDAVSSQYLNGQPSLADLAPGSAFLASLNSSDNVARESGAIPTRVGFNVQLDGGYWGGPLRLRLGAASADYLGQLLVSYGWYLEWDALENLWYLDWWDPMSWEWAFGLFAQMDLGAIASSWPNIWCETTSWNWGCEPSDGIVPTARQWYPNATNYSIVGPAHTEETADWQVIDNITQVLNSAR